MFGIIGAMDVEIASIKNSIKNLTTVKKSGIDFHCGIIGNTDVVVAKCSPCKVNAAICTQIIIDNFDVKKIINVGVGCSIDKNVKIGDIVIATDVCEYDIDISALGEPLGYFECYDLIKFSADEVLSAELQNTANSLKKTVHRGTIASGDTFISTEQLKNKIKENFSAICGEMEGGAIGHTCYQNNIPFAVIRSISDGGDECAQIDYPTFKKIAAENSTAIILNLLK